MIVSCGLNIGKLLKVLNEGLLKEETRLAPLLCLVGNEVPLHHKINKHLLNRAYGIYVCHDGIPFSVGYML